MNFDNNAGFYFFNLYKLSASNSLPHYYKVASHILSNDNRHIGE